MARPADSLLLAIDFPTLLIVPDWVEQHCVIRGPDGKFRNFEHYDWQLFCTANHYRVNPAAVVGQKAAAFHNRRSQVIAPQKTGKGPWSATFIAGEAVGPVLFDGWAVGGEVYDCREHGCGCGWTYAYLPGEAMGRPWPTALIQMLAASEDQVANVFRPLQAMIRNGPLGDLMRVGEEFIRCPNDGLIESVTSSALSRLGAPLTACLQDETGTYTKTNGLIEVAETMRRGLAGMGGRAVETTNCYDPAVKSTGSKTFKSKSKDVFRYYDEPPKDLDYTKAADRHQIHVYNYRLSPHVDVTDIDREADELCEEDPSQAERFYGNRMKAAGDRYFDVERWDELADPKHVVPDKAWIGIGVDGARFDDALAIVPVEIAAKKHLWLPSVPGTGDEQESIWTRPVHADDDYEHPLDQADAVMTMLFERYRVWRAYIDPQWIEILYERWAGRWGDRIVPWVTHRPKPMAYSLRAFRQSMSGGDLSHDGNSTLTEHIGNARRRVAVGVYDEERRPMYTIGKATPDSPDKIDGAMAADLALEVAGDAIAAGLLQTKKRATARKAR